MDNLDKRMLEMLALMSPGKSGAIIADRYRHVYAIGFYVGLSEHAAENALRFAAVTGKGTTAYLSHAPCERCETALRNAGVARIVVAEYIRASQIGTLVDEDA